MYLNRKKTLWLYGGIMLCFLAVIVRLLALSIGQGESIQSMARQHTLKVTVAQRRGNIYDRNMNKLVNTNVCYQALVEPRASSDLEELVETLADCSSLKQTEISELVYSGQPFCLRVHRNDIEMEGVRIFRATDRYSEDQCAVHLIGYLDDEGQGVAGLEKCYDGYLTNHAGAIEASFVVDAGRKSLPGLGMELESSSYYAKTGLVLSLDAEIQQAVERVLGRTEGAGAVVLLDVASSDVLAMASYPGYQVEDVSNLLDSAQGELRNRALESYNVGSVFKILVAAAALEQGVSPGESYTCTGSYTVGDAIFYCHEHEGHGQLTMKQAFEVSCNPYFMNLAIQVGKEPILAMAEKLGIGQAISLAYDLYTATGNLPDESDMAFTGALANLAIGQGELMMTPVHVARLVQCVAAGGVVGDPALVLGSADDYGNFHQTERENNLVRVFSEKTAAQITDFMIGTVSEGPASSASSELVAIAGKTSSAETGWVEDGQEMVQAWFGGFFPAEEPKFAMAVLCENGRSGAGSAAPLFKEIAEEVCRAKGMAAASEKGAASGEDGG